jgi:ribonuclease-3
MNNLPDFSQLEKNLQVSFKNKALLFNALTHRSFLNESKKDNLTSNERVEFLGDSILAFWVSSQIYWKFPTLPEGKLTFIRTHLVRTETLAKLAINLNLGQYLMMSRGEEMGKGKENPLLLANCFEAVTGSIFLDQGIEVVSQFLERQFKELIDLVEDAESLKDSKSLLQEKVQAKGSTSPIYKLISAVGPDHAKTWTMGVYVENQLLAEGSGESKQEAEEQAAKKALASL